MVVDFHELKIAPMVLEDVLLVHKDLFQILTESFFIVEIALQHVVFAKDVQQNTLQTC